MNQPSLLDLPLAPMRFGGETYDPAKDEKRLTGQWLRVYAVMKDGNWHSLREIHYAIRKQFQQLDSEAGISARLRDFRKERFGSMTVERRRRNERGLFEYRLCTTTPTS